jgi:hypothetical protein
MRSILAARLSILDISLGMYADTRWGILFQVISERLRDAPLSDFSFYEDSIDIVDYPDHNADGIRHLYIFPDVTSFKFDSDTSFELDDHWIKEIAMAWPNLTTLELGLSRWPLANFSEVTVTGLAFLVRKCQNLSTIHMQTNGRIIGPLLEDEACGSMPNVRMESISLGYSPIEDVAQVAMVLARALPNLRRIEVNHGGDIEEFGEGSEHACRWREVVGLVREILEQEDELASRSKQG